MNPIVETRVIRLISRLLDHCISPEERKELAQLIESDKEAREVYVKVMNQEAILSHTVDRIKAAPSNNQPILFRILKSRVFAVAAALMLGFSMAWLLRSELQLSTGEKTFPVAFLRTSSDERPTLFPSGSHSIKKGAYILDFFSGAQVRITAPAEFEVLSSIHLHLKKGQLVANVSPAARLFKITSERNSFVDLGTEFSLNVDEGGKSDLLVHEGEVVANTINDDGATEQVEIVSKNEALHYNHLHNRFDKLEAIQENFLQHEVSRSVPIPHLQAYQQQVKSSKPAHYWDFGVELGDSHTDSIGGLMLQAKGNHIETTSSEGNSAIYFSNDSQFHELTLNGLIEFRKNQAFSIEFLFCADRINRASMFSLFDPDSVTSNGSAKHFVLIETMAEDGWYSHIPACVRSVYRPVADTEASSGINSFGKDHYYPGVWTHLVISFDGRYLRTYQNSRLQNEVHIEKNEPLNESSRYAMVLGQMASYADSEPPSQNHRPFMGLIDELAIYDRVLTADEIKSHVRELPRD